MANVIFLKTDDPSLLDHIKSGQRVRVGIYRLLESAPPRGFVKYIEPVSEQ
ncbi:DUF3221 domain-containing protein [Caldibacillus debilis]|uniref:DUF3221 domain-containing protein n=1 Tax=Caldibacillus debilis TaxID=301148 RepID=UPI003C6BFFC9